MPISAPPERFAKEVVDVDIVDEMPDDFMRYAMYVIEERALPDVRDGLKPVQRRILYVMHHELGLHPNGGHRKSAGIVGEVMGKYHPHGDGAIYGAVVNMAQDVSTQMPLVDPRGNFGGLDDPPAAYRYTEARLSEAATALLSGINQNAVDMKSTFDGERQEPTVLPAHLPNLLVNGAIGIAVGMSTYIPPHNLEEIVKAVRIWMMSPEGKVPTLARLMKVVQGPDFPVGGILTGDLKEVYSTGRGLLKLRARCEIRKGTPRRRQLVFDELPYQVGAESIIARIQKGVKVGRIKGVADVSNTSGQDGPQVTVTLSVGTSPEEARDALYSATQLENTVSVRAVALVDGSPKTLGLREMIKHYAEHLREVTLRRAHFVLEQALRRAHILRGLLVAVSRIDEVIATIRASEDSSSARQALMRLLDIDEEQAEAFLEMRFRRLTALEEDTLRKDLAEQEVIIKSRTEVINDDNLLRAEAVKNMEQAAKGLYKPRRTEIT